MRFLLLLPFIGLLWVPFYNGTLPTLFGFPFFYWYQLAWVPLTSCSSGSFTGANGMNNAAPPPSPPCSRTASTGPRRRCSCSFSSWSACWASSPRTGTGPKPSPTSTNGAGRPAVRHLDHLVPGRRRFLHRLHGDRRARARLCARVPTGFSRCHTRSLSIRSFSSSCRSFGPWRRSADTSPRPTWCMGLLRQPLKLEARRGA